ncbi:MAG TPA: thiol-disulfide oxidoreductase DCC family protein [Longimicrobium sp.]|nr:thiol-disulfide oxidoreductase DCC family protein [Longimicrobium sp.]
MTPPVVLYDGVCGLCDHLVKFIVARDRRGRFRFAALQGETGQALLRQHGLPTEDFNSAVLVEDGRAYLRSAAIVRIVCGLGGFWRVFLIARVIPPRLLDVGYDAVARARYRFFGRSDACLLPPPEIRARFLP